MSCICICYLDIWSRIFAFTPEMNRHSCYVVSAYIVSRSQSANKGDGVGGLVRSRKVSLDTLGPSEAHMEREIFLGPRYLGAVIMFIVGICNDNHSLF